MTRARDPHDLVAAARGGDRGAVARLISLVESDGPEANTALATLFPMTGNAHVIGITGAPGAGKSTLTDRLVATVRTGGDAVAVLAIDPSSPFSGGAILGDRIRMQDHVGDTGVYIRSMASRGHLGGLSAAAPKAVTVLDGAGFPYVFLETVGVGQAEVEVAARADTTVVVVTPGWGDGIQAAKAGLLEIGDVFVVNKADRKGVAGTVRDLNQMLDLGKARPWRPPVLTTTATKNEGVAELWAAIDAHRSFLESSGELESARADRLADELAAALALAVRKRAAAEEEGARFQRVAAEVVARRVDPWTAAAMLIGTGGQN